jgi:hypothetical protein
MIALSDLMKSGEDRVIRKFLHNYASSPERFVPRIDHEDIVEIKVVNDQGRSRTIAYDTFKALLNLRSAAAA